jgi:hypothetical protein
VLARTETILSAATLGITGPQHHALLLALEELESGRIRHEPHVETDLRSFGHPHPHAPKMFNINYWHLERTCGSVCCIGGLAEHLAGHRRRTFSSQIFEMYSLMGQRVSDDLEVLLFPMHRVCGSGRWNQVTPAEAAAALRHYLTTGDGRTHWEQRSLAR